MMTDVGRRFKSRLSPTLFGLATDHWLVRWLNTPPPLLEFLLGANAVVLQIELLALGIDLQPMKQFCRCQVFQFEVLTTSLQTAELRLITLTKQEENRVKGSLSS
uniref:Uncharacterized protein n=1 Tax=Lygus hesperus TaxID=30085 RepID=A0A0K8S7N8_LYGHE